MKNKKLFAILTLVCFMFTLMPVAAFAAAGDVDATTSAFVVADGEEATINVAGSTGVTETVFKVVAKDNARNDATQYPTNATSLYVWATDASGARTSALNVVNAAPATFADSAIAYVKEIAAADLNQYVRVSFARAGEYTVHAGIGAAGVTELSEVIELTGDVSPVITVLGTTANPENYDMDLTSVNGIVSSNPTTEVYSISSVKPNNVAEEYVLTFTNNAKALTGKTVTIETDSDNITVNQKSQTTNYEGKIKFDLTASREGIYTLYVTVDGKLFTVTVNCTNTSAAYIKLDAQPSAPLALFTTTAEFDGEVTFEITDINGNAVLDAAVAGGADNLYSATPSVKAKYLYFAEKPAGSALTNAHLSLDAASADGIYDLNVAGTLDKEGTYTVKAILDNGAVATATWEVKAFGTPVMLYLELADVAELGKALKPVAKYVDANGVTKLAKDADIAATGYAVSYVQDTITVAGSPVAAGVAAKWVGIKTDEKYAGQNIKVTAVSERYDLVYTKEVKIADEATTVTFEDDTLEVNVNNKVDWYISTEDGTKVRIDDAAGQPTVKYVVLDAPKDAKVSVYNVGSVANGEGTMALTSNKVGNVTVQIVVQYRLQTAGATAGDITAVQNKYYTATEIFAVGTEDKGDVVVMSVGSNEIVINDAKSTIAAAPIVENNRTFVPFRALAEAFGAEVAWDEATQSVTASLNGVEIVMTIGSAEYTINGEAATMDVAPFINGASTMVPVRFAAEAFGIKVIPTYDENGATADILFNL